MRGTHPAHLWVRIVLVPYGWRQTIFIGYIYREHRYMDEESINVERNLMCSLVEGTLDIGVMYTPGHVPDMIIEYPFDWSLVMASTDSNTR